MKDCDLDHVAAWWSRSLGDGGGRTGRGCGAVALPSASPPAASDAWLFDAQARWFVDVFPSSPAAPPPLLHHGLAAADTLARHLVNAPVRGGSRVPGFSSRPFSGEAIANLLKTAAALGVSFRQSVPVPPVTRTPLLPSQPAVAAGSISSSPHQQHFKFPEAPLKMSSIWPPPPPPPPPPPLTTSAEGKTGHVAAPTFLVKESMIPPPPPPQPSHNGNYPQQPVMTMYRDGFIISGCNLFQTKSKLTVQAEGESRGSSVLPATTGAAWVPPPIVHQPPATHEPYTTITGRKPLVHINTTEALKRRDTALAKAMSRQGTNFSLRFSSKTDGRQAGIVVTTTAKQQAGRKLLDSKGSETTTPKTDTNLEPSRDHPFIKLPTLQQPSSAAAFHECNSAASTNSNTAPRLTAALLKAAESPNSKVAERRRQSSSSTTSTTAVTDDTSNNTAVGQQVLNNPPPLIEAQ